MAEKKVVKKIGVLSYAKISAIIYAVIGLFMGIFNAIMMAVISAVAPITGEAPPVGLFALFGVAGIIIWPIIYALIGFIFGALGALIYNLIAKWVGGVEIVFE